MIARRTLARLALGCAGWLTAGMIASAAFGQPACTTHQGVKERLAIGYGEAIAWQGLSGESYIVELWVSQDADTWTITVTDARGVTCMIGAGTLSQFHEFKLPDTGVPG